MLNDCTLLENILLSDEYLMEIVGCLEHDPELMVHLMPNLIICLHACLCY